MPRIAVCSWSLKPSSPESLLELCRSCGISAVQLWLDPIRQWQWRPDAVGSLFRAHGLTAVSGMFAPKGEDYSTLETIKATGGVRPDETWEANQKAADGVAIMAARFAIPLVTFHAGFIPHDAQDPGRAAMVQRLRHIAEIMAARNVRVALETGQEDAATLETVLAEVNQGLPGRALVGVNFDPANMILYGMGDPVASLKRLMPHVMQVHIKDADPTTKRGEWGTEKVAGQGKVDWQAFFGVLRDHGYAGDFVIEREAGDDRVADVRVARDLIEKHWKF
jgi:L-ribulose-5-phosphate 3-epimerase